ncbi:MAG: Diaminopimelate epimerase, partial [uncultured Sphingomonadaceae bacterium]
AHPLSQDARSRQRLRPVRRARRGRGDERSSRARAVRSAHGHRLRPVDRPATLGCGGRGDADLQSRRRRGGGVRQRDAVRGAADRRRADDRDARRAVARGRVGRCDRGDARTPALRLAGHTSRRADGHARDAGRLGRARAPRRAQRRQPAPRLLCPRLRRRRPWNARPAYRARPALPRPHQRQRRHCRAGPHPPPRLGTRRGAHPRVRHRGVRDGRGRHPCGPCDDTRHRVAPRRRPRHRLARGRAHPHDRSRRARLHRRDRPGAFRM